MYFEKCFVSSKLSGMDSISTTAQRLSIDHAVPCVFPALPPPTGPLLMVGSTHFTHPSS